MYDNSYNKVWLFNFLPIWYVTHKLKQRKKTENWDDDQYYEQMYSIPFLTHMIFIGNTICIRRWRTPILTGFTS